MQIPETLEELFQFLETYLPENVSGKIDAIDVVVAVRQCAKILSAQIELVSPTLTESQEEIWKKIQYFLQSTRSYDVTASNNPPTWVTGDADLFTKHQVFSAGTYANWNNITVTTQELAENEVFFSFENGEITKKLDPKRLADPSQFVDFTEINTAVIPVGKQFKFTNGETVTLYEVITALAVGETPLTNPEKVRMMGGGGSLATSRQFLQKNEPNKSVGVNDFWSVIGGVTESNSFTFTAPLSGWTNGSIFNSTNGTNSAANGRRISIPVNVGDVFVFKGKRFESSDTANFRTLFFQQGATRVNVISGMTVGNPNNVEITQEVTITAGVTAVLINAKQTDDIYFELKKNITNTQVHETIFKKANKNDFSLDYFNNNIPQKSWEIYTDRTFDVINQPINGINPQVGKNRLRSDNAVALAVVTETMDTYIWRNIPTNLGAGKKLSAIDLSFVTPPSNPAEHPYNVVLIGVRPNGTIEILESGTQSAVFKNRFYSLWKYDFVSIQIRNNTSNADTPKQKLRLYSAQIELNTAVKDRVKDYIDGNATSLQTGLINARMSGGSFTVKVNQSAVYMSLQPRIFQGKTHEAIAFSNEQGDLMVGLKKNGETVYEFSNVSKILPATFIKQVNDNHNYYDVVMTDDGYVIVSGNMHNNVCRSAITKRPYDLTDWEVSNYSTNTSITYPLFFKNPTTGQIIIFFREGGSGNGDTYCATMNMTTRVWNAKIKIIDGVATSKSFYPVFQVLPTGKIIITGGFRAVYDNIFSMEGMYYLESDDWGTTWKKSNGDAYTLPTTQTTLERVYTINGNGYVNMEAMLVDNNGKVHIVVWQNYGGHHNYAHLSNETGTWVMNQITSITDGLSTNTPEKIVLTRQDKSVFITENNKIYLHFSHQSLWNKTKLVNVRTGAEMVFKKRPLFGNPNTTTAGMVSNPFWGVYQPIVGENCGYYRMLTQDFTSGDRVENYYSYIFLDNEQLP